MRSSRTEFDDMFIGGLITAVEIGLGESGELKYPSFSEKNDGGILVLVSFRSTKKGNSIREHGGRAPEYLAMNEYALCPMSELRRFAPNVPVVLVDLRDDRGYLADHIGSNVITSAQGEELRKQISAAAYIECSSKTQQVVLQPPRRKEVVRQKRRRTSGCSIMGIICGGCAA
ncbi:hypothetical protein L2E82_14892 [Cichorium intybus]|uniref:Uncharacterized protein n=1 Tax=Cichorium intybus TaxID=13427 RepID=A0ACB9F1Q1_CICIN|nr:hypothetical protein L2E82_14892 [Cichorium intybus]